MLIPGVYLSDIQIISLCVLFDLGFVYQLRMQPLSTANRKFRNHLIVL